MDVFLFDLDGTLVDSIGDIAKCANIVRDSYGLPPLPEELIFSFIGKGSRHLMARTLTGSLDGPSPSEEALDEAVERWTHLYEKHMMDKTRLFPGIWEALTSLSGPRGIVTNKPGRSARELCRRARLNELCAAILGMGDVAELKPSPAGIREALSILAPKWGRGDRAVFVGDSAVDGEAAHAAGLPFVGVTWGLGTEAELLSAGASALARIPTELPAKMDEAMAAHFAHAAHSKFAE